ncbi:MAG TPA: hypothetical protein VL282_15835 [Tepidisphaeraceae bacterium]|nr:hypothetical protein [Tepidisphaeraceae bacterium]
MAEFVIRAFVIHSEFAPSEFGFPAGPPLRRARNSVLKAATRYSFTGQLTDNTSSLSTLRLYDNTT